MRAQISMDFILTVAISFVAIGAIAAVGASLIDSQTDSTARQQLEAIGTELASSITASALLTDADSASLNLIIPKVLVPGEDDPLECDIVVDVSNRTITLSLQETGTTVVKSYVPPPNITVPATAKCGETITLNSSGTTATAWLCMDEGYGTYSNPEHSDYIKNVRDNARFEDPASTTNYCGYDGYYVIQDNGGQADEITLTTPNSLDPGDYVLEFIYEIGTAGENNEHFEVTCGDPPNDTPRDFQDSVASPEGFVEASVSCNFKNAGQKDIIFTSTGNDGVNFEAFRIYGG